ARLSQPRLVQLRYGRLPLVQHRRVRPRLVQLRPVQTLRVQSRLRQPQREQLPGAPPPTPPSPPLSSLLAPFRPLPSRAALLPDGRPGAPPPAALLVVAPPVSKYRAWRVQQLLSIPLGRSETALHRLYLQSTVPRSVESRRSALPKAPAVSPAFPARTT